MDLLLGYLVCVIKVSVLVSDGEGDPVVAFDVPRLRPISGGRDVEVVPSKSNHTGVICKEPSFFNVTISAIKGWERNSRSSTSVIGV
jgi:hypothetical protein